MQRITRNVILLGSFLAAITWIHAVDAQSRRESSAGSAWSYRVLDIIEVEKLAPKGTADFTVGLNQLGAQGWELVAVETGIPSPNSVAAHDRDITKPVYFAQHSRLYFKRPMRR